MDTWGWDELQSWLSARAHLTRTASTAGIRRRFAPHQLRHAHAVEMAREGVPLVVIHGIDNAEIIDTLHACHAPMVPVSATHRHWRASSRPLLVALSNSEMTVGDDARSSSRAGVSGLSSDTLARA